MNRWHALLTYWIDVQFRHSLTFAFLLGALRNPVGSSAATEHAARGELARLLEEVQTFDSDSDIFHIYRCPDLDKLVLSRITNGAPPPGAATVVAPAGRKPILFASDVPASDSAVEVSALADAVWHECGAAVMAGRFSCRGKIFQEFAPDELTMIGRALA